MPALKTVAPKSQTKLRKMCAPKDKALTSPRWYFLHLGCKMIILLPFAFSGFNTSRDGHFLMGEMLTFK